MGSIASPLLLGGIPSIARVLLAERTVNGLKEVYVANSHLLHSVFLPSFHVLLVFMHFGLWDKFISISFFIPTVQCLFKNVYKSRCVGTRL